MIVGRSEVKRSGRSDAPSAGSVVRICSTGECRLLSSIKAATAATRRRGRGAEEVPVLVQGIVEPADKRAEGTVEPSPSSSS